jgi:hypothetical protein
MLCQVNDEPALGPAFKISPRKKEAKKEKKKPSNGW